ncbi:MAG: hypothetical protein ABQ298_04520 [Puniceicoccaceae bacterium]
MLDLLKDEAFLKPAAAILALILMLGMLRRINKILLVVGIAVITILYFLYNRPPWLESIWRNFQI